MVKSEALGRTFTNSRSRPVCFIPLIKMVKSEALARTFTNSRSRPCSDVGTTKNRVAITARYIRRENFVDLDALQMSDEPEEVLRLAQRLRVRNHGKPILHFHIPFETKRLDLSTSKFFKLLEMSSSAQRSFSPKK